MIDGSLLGGEQMAKEFSGFFPGSLTTIFGTLLTPIAFVMGVPWADAAAVGNLLGQKLAVNELWLSNPGDLIKDGIISERSAIIATYALCGFANFGSIGIQIGGIAALAPERRKDLARMGFKAMLGGAFATWLTACVAGLMIGAPSTPIKPTAQLTEPVQSVQIEARAVIAPNVSDTATKLIKASELHLARASVGATAAQEKKAPAAQ